MKEQTMTHKHYEKIAGVLAAEYAVSPNENQKVAIENVVASLADVFVQENPRFNRVRFYEAALGRDTVRPTVTGRA